MGEGKGRSHLTTSHQHYTSTFLAHNHPSPIPHPPHTQPHLTHPTLNHPNPHPITPHPTPPHPSPTLHPHLTHTY